MDRQWHPYDAECDCFLCHIERDAEHYDPGFEGWAESYTAWDGPVPEEGSPSSLRADALRHARIPQAHRKSRQRMTESECRMGARMGGG